MVLGDVWNVTDTNINYAWDGSVWDPLGSIVGVDVSLATPTMDGLLSATDFVKLSGIEANANYYVHPTTHSADIIVDGTTNKVYTATEKTKLAGIAEGAEVNVQSDWLSTDGDSLILNKPYVSDIEKRTITGALSSASYFKFAETPINPRGYMGHFRITVDSTTTTISQILDVWVMSSGENAPLVWAMSNTKSTTASMTGIYNIRCIYPKALDNGYNAQFELAANNTTARTIKIELISSSNVTLLSGLVASAPNATYQNTGSAVIVGYDGFVSSGTVYANVSGNATGSAGYTPLISNPFGAYTAGIALIANDFIILGTDLKWYKVSNAGITIPIGTVIASCGSTYALNAAVSTSYLIGNRTLQTGTSGTKVVGKDLYIRGTISGQNLVTDGYLTTELEAGYSYIRLGSLITATAIYLDGNNRLLTVDADTLLSKLDGYSFAASKVNGYTVEKNVPSDALFTDTISDWNAVTGNAVILNKPNLDAIVPISKGGTGLSEIGLANQLLKVNSNATGLEYFTPEFNNGSGTVTSISMSTPVGLIVSGSPITTSGTFSISFAEGYSIPTIIK